MNNQAQIESVYIVASKNAQGVVAVQYTTKEWAEIMELRCAIFDYDYDIGLMYGLSARAENEHGING